MDNETIKKEIVIGKYALESLTIGLYKNPYVVYREYIQNALDSIDEAVRSNLENEDTTNIEITINKKKKYIRFLDNGIGIKSSNALATLASIGASNKKSKDNRGFRGIGRLAGLGYCDKITFTTSAYGESTKSEVVIDSLEIRKALLDTGNAGNLEDMLENMVDIFNSHEDKSKHFFEITLSGVSNKSLLDIESVKDYISEIMPVPFDEKRFNFSNKINEFLLRHNIKNKTYNIIVGNGVKSTKIYKPYHNNFRVNISGTEVDKITDVSIEEISSLSGEMIGWMWYGKCAFKSTVTNNNIKGLRVKKSGITVGDRFILNSLFKENRFNGWLQGEVYLENQLLIPNSRRDAFENNKMYESVMKSLKSRIEIVCEEVVSANRVSNQKKASIINIKKDSSLISSIDSLVKTISSKQKNLLMHKFEETYSGEELEKINKIVQEVFKDG